MTDFTNVFGNTTIPPSDSWYASYTLNGDATFFWPYNYQGSSPIIYSIMDVACASGNSMILPPANQVSKGADFMIRNVGANTLTIKDNSGSVIGTIAVGVAQYFFVSNNSSAAGTWGQFTYGAGTSSATAGSLIGYGIKAIASSLNVAHQTYISAAGFTVDATYRAKTVVNNGGAVTMNLTAASTLGNDFFFLYKNSGTGTVTMTPNAGDLIDGQSSMTFQPGESAIINCSGSGWYTVGYGRSTDYQFGQLVLDVSAGGTITLTSAQASNKILSFTGNPAAGLNVVVPNVVAVYYVQSNISTTQVITIKTAIGAGTTFNQGQRVVVICDGTNVSAAQSPSVASSISLGDGSSSVPALAFASQTNTGFYKYSTNGLGISVNGTSQFQLDSTGLNLPTGLNVGGVAVPTISSIHTLTNKTISGANNTLSNIAAASITGTALVAANNLSELTGSAATARGNISAAKSGTNTDITALNAPFIGAATATPAAGTDNSSLVATTSMVQAAIQAAAKGHGQCQLQYVDSTHIKLIPKNGNLLTVNGVACTVPDGGLTYTMGALTPSTLYYIYATQSGGVINALVPSTTGHSTSTTAANKGVEIMTGDDSKTLVGMVWVGVGPAFFDDFNNRMVRSWFNDNGVVGMIALGANSYLNIGSYSELNGGYRCYVLCWAKEQIAQHVSISALDQSGNTNGAGVICNVDGTVYGTQGYAYAYPNFAVNLKSHGTTSFVSDGLHYLAISAFAGATMYAMLSYTGISFMTQRRG